MSYATTVISRVINFTVTVVIPGYKKRFSWILILRGFMLTFSRPSRTTATLTRTVAILDAVSFLSNRMPRKLLSGRVNNSPCSVKTTKFIPCEIIWPYGISLFVRIF